MSPRTSARIWSRLVLSVVLGLLLRGDVLTTTSGIDAVGALASLEQEFPFCHGEAHGVGRAVFSRTKDLQKALSLCGHRCTNGCMHGVLTEAIGPAEPASIQRLMDGCQDVDRDTHHKPANCAHAVGHGFLATAGRDLDRALYLCARQFDEALEYYCATGVFMQYAEDDEALAEGASTRPGIDDSGLPCHSTAFPAACYRYRLEKLAMVLAPEQLLEECLRLRGRARLGCFHGFGAMYYQTVGERPAALTVVCGFGGRDEQTMCIEGAVERLADHDERQARRACDSLAGDAAQVCHAAAREKMYRLDKPSMPLYLP